MARRSTSVRQIFSEHAASTGYARVGERQKRTYQVAWASHPCFDGRDARAMISLRKYSDFLAPYRQPYHIGHREPTQNRGGAPRGCVIIVPITLRVISAIQKPLVFEATSHGVWWVLSSDSKNHSLPERKRWAWYSMRWNGWNESLRLGGAQCHLCEDSSLEYDLSWF